MTGTLSGNDLSTSRVERKHVFSRNCQSRKSLVSVIPSNLNVCSLPRTIRLIQPVPVLLLPILKPPDSCHSPSSFHVSDHFIHDWTCLYSRHLFDNIFLDFFVFAISVASACLVRRSIRTTATTATTYQRTFWCMPMSLCSRAALRSFASNCSTVATRSSKLASSSLSTGCSQGCQHPWSHHVPRLLFSCHFSRALWRVQSDMARSHWDATPMPSRCRRVGCSDLFRFSELMYLRTGSSHRPSATCNSGKVARPRLITDLNKSLSRPPVNRSHLRASFLHTPRPLAGLLATMSFASRSVTCVSTEYSWCTLSWRSSILFNRLLTVCSVHVGHGDRCRLVHSPLHRIREIREHVHHIVSGVFFARQEKSSRAPSRLHRSTLVCQCLWSPRGSVVLAGCVGSTAAERQPHKPRQHLVPLRVGNRVLPLAVVGIAVHQPSAAPSVL